MNFNLYLSSNQAYTTVSLVSAYMAQVEIIVFLGFYVAQIGSYRRFRTSYQFHIQGANSQRRLIGCPDTSATSYQSTLHNITEK